MRTTRLTLASVVLLGSLAGVATTVHGPNLSGAAAPREHQELVDQDGFTYSNDLPPAAALQPAAAGITPPYPTANTFLLHSRAASTKKIYLDFNGHTLSGTQWNTSYTGGNPVTLSRFDIDGTATVTSTEHATIQRVWQRVREDFAPFDVDVTTEDPGVAAITKASATDNAFGVRVVITPTQFTNCGCGGQAYYGSFHWDVDTPALVYTNLSDLDKYIGEASSHEVGHSVGLKHDGTTTGADYYAGQGQWAPIMGNSYSQPVTHWSRGQYTAANNTEDDYAVMAANFLVPVPDDVLGTTATTATLPAGTTRYGVTSVPGDVDTYKFSLGSTHQLNIKTWNNVGTVDANMNQRLVLRNGAGTQIAISSPTTSLGTTMTVTLPAGVYYASVDGVGEGSSLTTGYSNYGSLGYYGIVLNWA